MKAETAPSRHPPVDEWVAKKIRQSERISRFVVATSFSTIVLGVTWLVVTTDVWLPIFCTAVGTLNFVGELHARRTWRTPQRLRERFLEQANSPGGAP